MRTDSKVRRGRTRARPTLLTAGLLAVALVGAACGGGSSDKAATDRPNAEDAQAAPAAAPSETTLPSSGEAAATEAATTPGSGPAASAGGTSSAGTASAGASGAKRASGTATAAPAGQAGGSSSGSPGKPGASQAASGGAAPAPLPGGGSPAAGGKANYASDVGVTDSTIKIGLINLASATRSLGPAVSGSSQKVTDAAVKYVNRTGGVAGRRLELVTCDDGGDVTRARACYEKLKSQVFAIMPGETFVTDVIHDRLVKDKVPWMSWGWFKSEYEDPWMFPVHANGMREAVAMAKWVSANLKPKRVGILYLNVSEDIAAKDEAVKVFKANGIEVVKTIAQEFDSADESQHVLAMRAADPDFIMGFSWPTPIAKFFHDANAQKWSPDKGYMFNHFGFDPGYGPIFGDYIKDRVYAIASWLNQFEDTPENTIYRDENNRTNSKEFIGFKFKYAIGHHLSQSGWVGVRTFAKAAERLGADLTREGFKKVLETNSWDSGLGVTLSWPEGNHNQEPYSFNREFIYKYVTGSDGGFDIKRIMPDAYVIDQ